jgi:hypothetical protein
MRHDAQLRICHERIGDDPAKKPVNAKWAWCDLPAFAWCFDCEYFVCEIHTMARHELHRTQVEGGISGVE